MSLDVALSISGTEIKEVFEANITHNLNRMAKEAGIYMHLWRPDEIGITDAGQLISPLQEGLARLRADPGRFRQLEPENKWGTYDTFVPWVERYLAVCEEYPHARVWASR